MEKSLKVLYEDIYRVELLFLAAVRTETGELLVHNHSSKDISGNSMHDKDNKVYLKMCMHFQA